MSNETKNNKIGINISNKQITRVTEHKTKVNKDGVPYEMAEVMIMSKEHRDVEFGCDENGNNLDDAVAYVIIPKNVIHADMNNSGRSFFYIERDRTYNVRFYGKKQEDGSYVNYSPLTVSGEMLANIIVEKKSKEIEDEDIKERRIAINISESQIRNVKEHSTKLDKDGSPYMMAEVMLPSKEYRENDFGLDENGNDRNQFNAYFIIPNNFINNDKKMEDRKYFYLDKERDYTVRFYGKKQEDGSYINVEPIKMKGSELANLYTYDKNKVLEKSSSDEKKEIQEDTIKMDNNKTMKKKKKLKKGRGM